MNYPKIKLQWGRIEICSEEDLDYLPTPSGEVIYDFVEQDIVVQQEDSYD